MAVYLIECEICVDQYTDSTKAKFRFEANNYDYTKKVGSSKERGSSKESPKTNMFS